MRRFAIGSALTLVLCGLFGSGCGGSVCEQAIRKLEGECGLGSGVAVPLGNGNEECRNDSDTNTYTECAAGCVLDSACEDITDKDQDNGYFDCLADCPD